MNSRAVCMLRHQPADRSLVDWAGPVLADRSASKGQHVTLPVRVGYYQKLDHLFNEANASGYSEK